MTKFQLRLQYFDDIKKFIQIMSEVPVDVDIASNRYTVDAKSIMGIFSLDLSKPVTITVHSDNNTIIDNITEKLRAVNII